MKEVLLIIAAFLLGRMAFAAMDLPMGGAFEVLLSLAVATWLLRRSRSGWTSIGLHSSSSLIRGVLATLGCLVAAYVAAGIAALVSRELGLPAINTSSYGDLPGNPSRLALLLLVAWTTAAFGEELLFRGFILERLKSAFAHVQASSIIAVLGQALLFGLAHGFQGPTGMLVSATVGLVFGVARIRGWSLWPLIVAHGLIDTIGLIALYSGWAPDA